MSESENKSIGPGQKKQRERSSKDKYRKRSLTDNLEKEDIVVKGNQTIKWFNIEHEAQKRDETIDFFEFSVNEDIHTDVEIWLEKDISPEVEDELTSSIVNFLEYYGYELIDFSASVHESFYKAFKFLGKKLNVKQLVANLSTSFELNVKNQEIEAITKLSKILEKQDNVGIRIGDIVAVKYTKNGASYVMIEVIDEETRALFLKNPELIKKPEKVYKMLESKKEYENINRRRKGEYISVRTERRIFNNIKKI